MSTLFVVGFVVETLYFQKRTSAFYLLIRSHKLSFSIFELPLATVDDFLPWLNKPIFFWKEEKTNHFSQLYSLILIPVSLQCFEYP